MSALTTALAAQAQYIEPGQAATYLTIAVGTLKHRRATGINCPPYWKTNDGAKAHVRYRLDELELWRVGQWTGPIRRVMGQSPPAPVKKSA
jgi:hypothetical protein